jgi:hypothetical protein
MIASSSGTSPAESAVSFREPVGVGRRHHELARLEADEDARQHGSRLVARRRARHAGDRVEQRPPLDGERLERAELWKAGEVLDAVGVEPVARRPALESHDALLGPVLESHVAGRQQPGDVEQQLARDDNRPLVADLRVQRRP